MPQVGERLRCYQQALGKIKAACEVDKNTNSNVMAVSLMRGMTDSQIKAIATKAVADYCDRFRREATLQAERSYAPIVSGYVTNRDGFQRSGDSDSEVGKKLDAARAGEEAYYMNFYKNPAIIYGEKEIGFLCYHGRKTFKSFCKRKKLDFDKWLEKARKIAAPRHRENLEADWYPDGVYAYGRDKWFDERVVPLIGEMANMIKLEITEKLLKTKFALGDGEWVSWGAATVSQHQIRIEMLNKNTKANLEAAARHKVAIDKLKEARVPCLAKLPK